MTTKNLEIHSENILPIIKKWLYSEREIFARELVSNAVDALRKVKILRDRGLCSATDDEFRITITPDKEKKTLTFTDTGVGMDAHEVETYIAQIAFSGAEDFAEKYQTNKEGDQFIGHFGLGFYSAYMVASKVEIDTLSYKEGAKPVFWSCDGSSSYEIDDGTRTTRGTTITLHLDDENSEFLEEPRLKEILHHYCDFLPYPVYLGEEKINKQEPLWIKNPSECTDKEYRDFYRHLYPMDEEPLFWIHLNVDYPFHLQGILYFPKLKRDIDLNQNSIHLYCNRVFVSDSCKDIIPHYLMALRGVIDSPDIPLNVSRSYLQVDRTVRQLSTHISKKVADNLEKLHNSDKERFEKVWSDASLVVKMGILEDDKFYEKVKKILVWKEIDGSWTTIEDYLERNRDKTDNKVLYSRDKHHLPHLVKLYKEKGIEVLLADSPIDSYVMQHLERKLSPTTFQRIDGALHDNLLDKEREKNVLDSSGKTEAAHLADFVRAKLGLEQVEVEAKSLNSDHIPALVVVDENQRRLREYMAAMAPEGSSSELLAMQKSTFVVNTNNRLLASIQKLDAKNPELAKELVQEVYDLALLSQREMMPDQLQQFVERTNVIMEKLMEAAVS